MNSPHLINRSDAPGSVALDARTVIDSFGMRIGQVRRTFVDDFTSRPSWITVRTGWLRGSESIVPLADAVVQDLQILVPYSKRAVRDAPLHGAHRVLSEVVVRRLTHYYSLERAQVTAHGTCDREGSSAAAQSESPLPLGRPHTAAA